MPQRSLKQAIKSADVGQYLPSVEQEDKQLLDLERCSGGGAVNTVDFIVGEQLSKKKNKNKNKNKKRTHSNTTGLFH